MAKTYRSSISRDEWTPGEITHTDALRSLAIPNAGGKSEISEAFSMQYFYERYRASHFLCEMEVSYWIHFKMVDFICTIKRKRMGVSVTRAMGYPESSDFTGEDALKLLRRKLYGLIVARNSTERKHRFFKSTLHVFCQTPEIADLVEQAFVNLDIDDFGLNVIGALYLQLTVCSHKAIYRNILVS